MGEIFTIDLNDLDEGLEGTLSRCEDDPKKSAALLKAGRLRGGI